MEEKVAPLEVLLKAFPGIEPEQAEEIIASGQVSHYPPGMTLCREGAFESIFYIILSGQVQVTKEFDSAGERKLNRLGAGTFFGEMGIIHNAPRAANVTTTEPTTVLEIYKDCFTGLLEQNKSVSLAIIREVSRRLRENDEMAIEDLRLKAKELANAYQQLAEEEYARSQFLSTVAHELRTPLMAANGYLQAVRLGMIQGDALPAALDVIWRNMQDITSLTNDILFLQEMDLILPEFHPVDIIAVLHSAIEEERPLAERTGVRIRLDVIPGFSPISGDPKSLQRALGAILNNAIKFSPDGGEVSVTVQPSGSNGEREIVITIQDQGVGIPPEAMHRIFQRFFHLDIICGKVFRGIGLGLSIAKHVIDEHHGRIEVQSELGKGSTFTVRLKTS